MTEPVLPDPSWMKSGAGALVFWCMPEELLADGREDEFMTWLDGEERARHGRFVFPHSKREFLAGRALLRRIIGGILGRAPESLNFTFNSDGKPTLAGIETPLQFNLTHTRGLAALAVHPSLEIGVDAEVIERDRADANLAKRFFSIHETRHLWKFEEEAYADEFFRIWTMKEAYIKARGTGMRTPLGQFHILPSGEPDRYAIGFEPEAEDDPALWQIESRRPTPNHFLAAAIKKGRRKDVPFEVVRIARL